MYQTCLQVWVWEYPTEGDDEQVTHHDLYMDPGEEIRFRVTSEVFVDTSPTGGNIQESTTRTMSHLPNQASGSTSNATNPSTHDPEGKMSDDKKVPFFLKASINEPGLGLLSWWNNS